ncbi:inositol 5-phosphatase [Thecamonas trahens ATCC 50062]|uniref:Inositol 5-phosphatase n=1 Tax=Thecamonas trahens ATCC 50062 TaxID=461836 RepID=A0A0L0DA10_THETB|nr:inositol 5-phosphatase [Thecamonas trahens ATCC 50062]KNC49184.1 inositol 5-phosphatase [Thecamonas trahens ATCC 50062]|eukprot:XP_013758204.1 inositol 5-phosphatase [Thecamonas trahens ATCC 50062]
MMAMAETGPGRTPEGAGESGSATRATFMTDADESHAKDAHPEEIHARAVGSECVLEMVHAPPRDELKAARAAQEELRIKALETRRAFDAKRRKVEKEVEAERARVKAEAAAEEQRLAAVAQRLRRRRLRAASASLRMASKTGSLAVHPPQGPQGPQSPHAPSAPRPATSPLPMIPLPPDVALMRSPVRRVADTQVARKMRLRQAALAQARAVFRRDRARLAKEARAARSRLDSRRRVVNKKRAVELKILAREERVAVNNVAFDRARARVEARTTWGIGPFPATPRLTTVLDDQTTRLVRSNIAKRRLRHMATTLYQDTLHWSIEPPQANSRIRRGSVSPDYGTEGILSPEAADVSSNRDEWVSLQDADGSVYYLHLATNTRSSERPTTGRIVSPRQVGGSGATRSSSGRKKHKKKIDRIRYPTGDPESMGSTSDEMHSRSRSRSQNERVSGSSSSDSDSDSKSDGCTAGDDGSISSYSGEVSVSEPSSPSAAASRPDNGSESDNGPPKPTLVSAGSSGLAPSTSTSSPPKEVAMPSYADWESLQSVELMTFATMDNKSMTLRPKRRASRAGSVAAAESKAAAEAAAAAADASPVVPLAETRVRRTEAKSIQRFDVYVLKGSGFFKGFKPRVLEVNIKRQSFAIIQTRRKGEKRKELRAADVWRFEKCKSDANKLYIVFEGKTPTYTVLCLSPSWRDLVYETLWATHIDAGNKIGQLSFPLSVWVGSWNMGNAPPPDSLGDYLPTGEHDMYAFCVQECKYVPLDAHGKKIPCETRDHWYDYVQEALGPGYVVLCKHSLWEIRLVVAVRSCHYNKIMDVEFSKVATGIANVAGNKGGVAVSFNFFETSFCFIGAHLAAHQSKIAERNADYANIVAGLRLGTNKEFDITNVADYVFWCGDLNYRIELPRDAVIEFNLLRSWDVLFANDQLQAQIAADAAFVGFTEATLDFPCTYKYARNTRTYAAGKHPRIPAWCDRIMWKCESPTYQPDLVYFTDCKSIMTSDHAPVSALFTVSVQVPYRPEHWDRVALPCALLLSDISVSLVQPASKAKPGDSFLAVWAPFLPGSHSLGLRSSVVKKSWEPHWDGDSLPLLRPSLSEPDFIAKQSIILAVIDAKSGTSRGEAKLPLGPHIRLPDDDETAPDAPFSLRLLKGGLVTGSISGSIALNIRGGARTPSLTPRDPSSLAGGSGDGGAVDDPDGTLMMVFTCDVCETRSAKTFSRHAYHHGVVLVRCDGCQSHHLVADNLGWTDAGGSGAPPGTLEAILKAKGKELRKLDGADALEYVADHANELESTLEALKARIERQAKAKAEAQAEDKA